jgi:hypothetical protein
MGDILANGSTFLIQKKPMPVYIELDNGHNYVPVVRHDMSLVEVANEDVAGLLLKKCGCCDSVYTCFDIATPAQIDLWRSPSD